MIAPPILTIPTELTQQIMLETLIANSDTQRFPRPIRSEAPLAFTAVSRQWREISLNMPELWQSIRLDDSTPTVPPQVLTVWGSRARSLPRNIQLRTSDPDRAAALLAESVKSCVRWQDIDLALPLESFSALHGHGPFPVLRSICLTMRGGMTASDDTIIALPSAPLLRRLTLSDFPFLSVDMPWAQLTTLRITVYEAAPGLAVLQRCPNIKNLVIALMDDPGLPTAMPPIVLPALQYLRSLNTHILPFVTVPSLTQLDIWGPGPSGTMEQLIDDLRALLARSVCSLKRLTYRSPRDITPAQFLALLEAVAAVEDLELAFPPTGLLEKLRDVLQIAHVLPRLGTLRLRYGVGNQESFDPLLDALRSRRKVVEGRATLAVFSLHLEPGANLPPAVRNQLFAFRDQGMDISIVDL